MKSAPTNRLGLRVVQTGESAGGHARHRPRSTALLTIAAVLTLALAAAAVFVVSYDISHGLPIRKLAFDPEVWVANTSNWEADNPRGRMFIDLSENYLRRGMTIGETVDLLGEPEFRNRTEMDQDRVAASAFASTEFQYTLGAWSGMGSDDDWLHVNFGSDDRLTGFAWVQH